MSGNVTLPAEALRWNRRTSVPATQRTPWPETAPEETVVVPCRSRLSAAGFSRDATNASESVAIDGTPSAWIVAPPVAAELLQPCPRAAGVFKQGQVVTPARPGS